MNLDECIAGCALGLDPRPRRQLAERMQRAAATGQRTPSAAMLATMASRLEDRMAAAGHRPGVRSRAVTDAVRSIRRLNDIVDRHTAPVDDREWQRAVERERDRLVRHHGEFLATKMLRELYDEAKTRGCGPVLRRLRAEQT
jgi:hypothetical protein